MKKSFLSFHFLLTRSGKKKDFEDEREREKEREEEREKEREKEKN